MSDLLLSEAAWRVIPIVTSFVTVVGLVSAIMLLGIAKRDHSAHSDDTLQPVAEFMHERAMALCVLVALPVLAGILFTIAWLPAPPRTGRFIAVWANHYLVGSGSSVATYLTVVALRKRLRIERPTYPS